MLDLGGDGRHVLDGARPGPDRGHALAGERLRMVPAGRVERPSPEAIGAQEVGDVGDVEHAQTAHHHIGAEALTGLGGQLPGTGGGIPARLADGRAGADVGADPVPVAATLQVGEDLGLGGIGAAPPRVRLERVRVEVGGDVTGRPGEGVVPPGAPHPVGLLEDGEVEAGPLERHGHGDPPGPGAEHGDRRSGSHRCTIRSRLPVALRSTSSTRTPSGSTMVHMTTPATSIRRGGPPRPKVARRSSAAATSVMTESKRNPRVGGPRDSGPPGGAPRSTSSTMPAPGFAGSPRNTARSEREGAPSSPGQSPVNSWSISTSNPSPSRQKRRLASTSRTQTAEWWTAVTRAAPSSFTHRVDRAEQTEPSVTLEDLAGDPVHAVEAEDGLGDVIGCPEPPKGGPASHPGEPFAVAR